MKKIIYILGILVALIVVLIIVAPKSENVERSITIDQPVTEVYNYMVLLQNMEDWSPWAKKDPNAIHTYKGSGNTVGSIHFWNSTHEEVGVGEQEITSIIPNQEIYSELRFKEPFESTSQGYLKFENKGSKTLVTWGYNAEYKGIEAVIMMMMNMDKVLGGDFEKGLLDAKTILEK